MTYEQTYKQMVQGNLGREPRPDEGFSSERIAEIEKTLGFRLPESMRVYYGVFGSHEVNQDHNRLLFPPDSAIESGFLVFMKENQNVLFWAIKSGDATLADPQVWQIVNNNPREVYSEEKSFSQFIVEMIDWQFEMFEDDEAEDDETEEDESED